MLCLLECGDSSPLFRSFCAHIGKGVPAEAETVGLSSALSGKSSEWRDTRSRPLVALRLLQSGTIIRRDFTVCGPHLVADQVHPESVALASLGCCLLTGHPRVASYTEHWIMRIRNASDLALCVSSFRRQLL